MAVSYARLQCMKWRRFHFTEAAVGHFISKAARRSRRISIMKIPNFVIFVPFVMKYPTLYFAG